MYGISIIGVLIVVAMYALPIIFVIWLITTLSQMRDGIAGIHRELAAIRAYLETRTQ